ncbi:MAG: hypothetical protein KBD21_03480 [Candidatus Pacebacteria bacterium]|nr:hypothetical protein [Candidatus Paceibacterota bacterium]
MYLDTEHASIPAPEKVPTRASDVVFEYHKHVRSILDSGTYEHPESALFAPSDSVMRAQVHELTAPLRGQVRTVLLVGIGGSDLGTRAIYEALRPYGTASSRTNTPRLIVLHTVEPKALSEARAIIAEARDVQELVLVVVSKSGTTAETLTNANILFAAFTERFGERASGQTIVISDKETSLVPKILGAGMKHCPLPAAVGGRYSVFTPVGLVPLSLLGVDIDLFCEGGVAATHACFDHPTHSPAATLALIIHEHYRKGVSIHEFFVWHPELEMFGKWYRQLLAESIGKHDASGTPVGITPTVAIGSTDLHSLGQLVFGGPRTRFTTFLVNQSQWDDTEALTDDSPFLLDSLRGKKAGDIMRAIYGGVSASYRNDTLPFVTISLDAITPRELGACMALHMSMVMYLARLLSVNAFDQPDVERYKEETRRILAGQ